MPINYNIIDSAYFGTTELSKIYEGSVKKWEKLTEYFCVTAKEDGAQITMVNNGSNSPVLYYSIDDQQTWTLWDYSAITLASVNDKCYFYGNNPNGVSSSSSKYSNFSFSKNVTVSGNIQTLLTQSGAINIVPSYGFIFLFTNCNKLIDASGLKLPATILNQYCYGRLFNNCQYLTYGVEELPATSIPRFAYGYMYSNATRLVKASHIPENATITGIQAFDHMYQNCSYLKIVQEVLPPVTANYQYDGCFSGCGNLVKAPKIILASSGLYACKQMFANCDVISFIEIEVTGSVNISTFNNWLQNSCAHGTIMAPSTLSLLSDSVSGLPTNWDRVTPADVTPDYICFESLEDDNELSMTHYNSNRTVTRPVLYYSTDKSTWTKWDYTPISLNRNDKIYFYGENNVFTQDEFSGWSSFGSTKAVNASGNIMTLFSKYGRINSIAKFGCARLFENWTNLKTAPYFPDDVTRVRSSGCRKMFEHTGLVNAPSIPIVNTLDPWAYGLMFASCGDLETPPPVVGAVTLADSAAFYGMFSNCVKLKETPLLITKYVNDRAYQEAFLNCSSIKSVNLNYLEDVNHSGVAQQQSLQRAFYGCSNLSEVRISLNDLKTNNFYNWLGGTSVQGEFYNTGNATWPAGASGIPSNWQVFTDDGYYFVKNLSDDTDGNNYITIYRIGTPAMNELEYSYDRTTWTAIPSTGNYSINVSIGSKVFLRGNNPNGLGVDTNNRVTINPYFKASVGGDIRSLINKTNYTSETIMPNYAFVCLHVNSVNLYDARDLVIKYSTVSEGGLRAFCNIANGVNLKYAPNVSYITNVDVDAMRFFLAYTQIEYIDLKNITSFTTSSLSNAFNGSKIHAIVVPNATGFGGTKTVNWLANNPDKGIVYKTSSQSIGRGDNSEVPLTWCTFDYA